MVHLAAAIAQDIDSPEVREALRRHADEVADAQSRMKDAA
jgi:hypothetical protein